MAKLTLDELWCFPQKELIPFSGENTSLKENLYEILPNFFHTPKRCHVVYLHLESFYDGEPTLAKDTIVKGNV